MVLTADSSKPAPSVQSFGWPRPFRSNLVAPVTIPFDLAALFDSQLLAKVAAAGPEEEVVLAPKAALWAEGAQPIATFGLPPGLGELTIELSSEDLAGELVAPRQTFAAMIAGSPWSTHLRPRPAAAKVRSMPGRFRPAAPFPARPKFVAHAPDLTARPVPSY